MRIPPYYHNPGWQRFFAGIIIGAIIGFGFFIFINGVEQERQLQLIESQKKQIGRLEDRLNIVMEKEQKKNDELKKKLTVQSIHINLITNKKIKIDGLKQIDLKEQINSELRPLIGNDIESVAKNQALIFNAVNNHSFVIENKVYQVEVKSVTIYSDLEVQVSVKEVNEK